MYEKIKNVNLKTSVSAQVKNLQVVSFDGDWKEIYVGVARRDIFTAECPNNVPEAAKVTVKYQAKDKENAIISTSKWCPMENCTLLVLGSQYGVQIFDWDGANLVYEFDFLENGITGDEKQIVGTMARGIAALGNSYIAIGLHTGEIVLFHVELLDNSYNCKVVGKFRNHVAPITDLASSNSKIGKILVSGDSSGIMNIWSLEEEEGILVQKAKMEDWSGFPVTTLCIWNKYKEGIVAAGFGSGHIRLFSIPDGRIMCEIAAHNGWITGMDLASQSGLLLSCAEDGYVRVWQLATKGPLAEHWFSKPVEDCVMTGAKFMDPRGSAFCVCAYDSQDIQVFAM